jgi:hypothetical protein
VPHQLTPIKLYSVIYIRSIHLFKDVLFNVFIKITENPDLAHRTSQNLTLIPPLKERELTDTKSSPHKLLAYLSFQQDIIAKE